MNSTERAEAILEKITRSGAPVSGSALAAEFGVSRQIIVKDIAALKESGNDIIATTRGYILHKTSMPHRVFKVCHLDDEIFTELEAILEAGGIIEDVFVWHKAYGKIEARLGIHTRKDLDEYLTTLKSGRSGPLMNVTSGYHYHTVYAKTDTALDSVRAALLKLGFLVTDEEAV